MACLYAQEDQGSYHGIFKHIGFTLDWKAIFMNALKQFLLKLETPAFFTHSLC